MASIDVIRSCLDSIRQISDDVADALVYLDAGCAEAFQFVGAFSLLLELGVRAVCRLESMSSLDIIADWNSTSSVPARKMVVITSRLLSDAHRYILRCLGMHQTIVDCRIFTSISEVSHSAYIDSPLGPDAFREYESLLRLDYKELVKRDENKMLFDKVNKRVLSTDVLEENLSADANCWSQGDRNKVCSPNIEASSTDSVEPNESARLIISVHHFPMVYSALSPRVFILPSEGTIAEARLSDDHEDSLSPGLPAISTGHRSDGDDIPSGAMLTAHFLYHLAEKMDLKMDVFSLGDLSKTVGRILTDMSSLYDVGRRNKRSAGLLIIDRSLDLLTPCCHGDAVIDWMVSSLPRRERTTSSFHAKNSQLQSKSTSASVQHPPLDVKIPLGEVFGTGLSPSGNNQFLDSVRAFKSGWNYGGAENESVDSNVHKDKVPPRSLLSDESVLLSGSLVSCDSYKGVNCLEALLDRGIKDGVMLIKKWLLGTLHQDKVSANLKSRLSLPSSELLPMAKLLASNQMSFIRNKGIIQLAAASIFALSEPHHSHWNAFVSAERILKMSTGDSSQSLSSQIRDLINTSILLGSKHDATNESSQGLISFQDALLLAIIGYMLAGENFPTSVPSSPFSWEEEHSLKEAVVDAILEMPAAENLRFLYGLEEELEANYRKRKIEKQEATMETLSMDDLDDNWGSWEEDSDHNNEPYGDMQLKLELRDRVDHLFKFFHKISSLKWRNTAFRGIESRFGNDPFSNKGLLFKVLLMVLAKYEIPGLEYHSSVVGRFFKSGFGRFGLGQAKPSLGDHSILLVFVVGGINSLEVREAQEAIVESGRPDVELIIGGTTLLTPDNMFELLLGSSSYI